MFSRRHRMEWRCAIGLTAFVWATGASACGPFFPNTILDNPDEQLLQSPAASFRAEINRIVSVPQTGRRPACPLNSPATTTFDADTNDLFACFMSDGVFSRSERATFENYVAARKQVVSYLESLDLFGLGQRGYTWVHAPATRPVPPQLQVPEHLPAEFGEYLRGALAWHRADTNGARKAWETVLRLPPDQRQYRSTWAEFMLGRSCIDDQPDRAIAHLRRVRDLAKDGFRDSLDLATVGLGWEAFVELRRNNFDGAAKLYLAQHAAGDPTAAPSLRIVASRILGETSGCDAAVRSEPLRDIVTAYLIAADHETGIYWTAGPVDDAVARWLRAIESVNVRGISGADRLAWLAYQNGRMDIAKRWSQRAPQNSALALWIRAKLALRAGDIRKAEPLLEKTIAALPAAGSLQFPGAKKKAGGELAALRIRSQRYADSLDLLVRNGWWWDAAYVAERVMTPDELRAYVDAQWPEDPKAYSDDGQFVRVSYEEVPPPASIAASLRYLLARRLAREGKYATARPYFPPHERGVIADYASALAAGGDKARTEAARADAFWKVARIARYNGMELFGTELEPDWFTEEGLFDPEHLTDLRREARVMKLAGPTDDETARLRKSAESHPTRRFHYRYTAVKWAEQAADLMPDDSPNTAEVLCRAGSWLKTRDPKAADRFYKALVTRCPNTDLGRKADQIRWFPALPPDPLERERWR